MPKGKGAESEWREMPLGEVLTLQRGFDLPSKQRVAGPYPVVSSAGVTGTHAEFKAAPPGVVIGRYGSLGSVHWVDESYWPLNTALWVKDFKGNDPRYAYYLLQTVAMDGSSASAVPGVNRNHLHKIPVLRPELQTQLRVATVLSAFDDLIEINERRIRVLEDLARSLYREWFVRFRFPGHEGAELVDSELGPIPRGWSPGVLGEVTKNFDRLRKPLSKVERVTRLGDYPYYGAAKLIDWIDGWIFDGEYLLFAEDGTVQTQEGWPVLQLVEGAFWANNHTHILQGNGVSTRFLMLALERYPIGGHVTGAAQPKITQQNLNRVPLVIPDSAVLSHFENVVNPMIDAVQAAKGANRALAHTRDLLLPRLVTGRLDISDIDLGDLMPAEVA